MTLPNDRILKALTDPSNSIISRSAIYSALVFPEKDLKPVLERLGVENVSISPLLNGRETGLVYTVMDPEGNSRSFSLYEHRNTDSLVINGKTNWDVTESPYGPYVADSKHEFFAEHGNGEHKQAAETLGYFLKSAQDGTLESDQELVEKSERLDWNAIISERIPGFKSWLEDKGLEEPLTDDPRSLGF